MDHRSHHSRPCLGDPSDPVFQVRALGDCFALDSSFLLQPRTGEGSCGFFFMLPAFWNLCVFSFLFSISFVDIIFLWGVLVLYGIECVVRKQTQIIRQSLLYLISFYLKEKLNR